MATTTAKTKKDVDEMSAKDRLYDSLSYSYGKKGEKISKEYDKAYSQADRQLLSRGMQRSSYGAQTLANVNQQRIDALNDNESALIADYENRLGDIEAREQEQANWQAQFDASREDAAWNKEYQTNQFNWQKEQADRNYNYQVGRDAVADQQWNKQFEANRADTAWNQAFQTQQYNDSRADTAWQQSMTEKQYADSRADTAWQQGMTERQYADSRADTAWSQAFTEKQYADNRADTAWQQAFSEKQWQAQLDQWEKQFNYTQMSDEQKINYNYVTYSLQNGNDVSDEMLRKAGLSREDYNAMKSQAAASGGGGYGGGAGGTGGETGGGSDWQALGFRSEEAYNRAQALGMTAKEYYEYITENPDALAEELGSNGNKVGRSLAENANSMRLANDFGNAMNNGVQKVKAGATSVYNALYDYFNNPIQIDPVSTTQNGLELRDVEGDELDELLGKKNKRVSTTGGGGSSKNNIAKYE